MSVLIKGIDTPRDCYECDFAYTLYGGDCHCSLLGDSCVEPYMDKRAEDCPMIEIPTEHGDLIDRDKITYNDWVVDEPCVSKKNIDSMPVIVPREGVTQNEHI
jgi:hypothetical protein